MGCPSEAELLGYLRGGGANDPGVTGHVTSCDVCEQLLVAFGELSASRAPGVVPAPDVGDRLPEPGELLGRYELRETLGRGAMGIVYLAHDPKLDRRVAVKLVLQPQRTEIEEARILVEARAAARVHDAHLVGVYDVGAWHGRVFLAMEYVDGPSLARWLAAAPRDVEAIVRHFADGARGLAAVHAAGLVHCDVKPDNILIGPSGTKLGDFGLAVGPELAIAAGLRGTPAYMAPELMRGGMPSAAGDQFALCVSLFEAIAGARPERPADAHARLARPARMPRWLHRVVARGLAFDPARRFSSVAELAGALTRRGGRRWLAFGGAAGALAMAGGVALVLTGSRAGGAPCPAPSATLADELRHVQLLARLGPDDGARANARLDAFRTAWTTASVSACRATRVEHRYSDDILDRRTHCLERARARYDGLIELVLEPGTKPPANTLDAIDRLPDVSACDDIAALTRRALPTTPDARARLSAAGSKIDLAMEQVDLRRPEAALSLLAEHRGVVTGLGPAVEAEAQYVTGLAQSQLGRTEEASAAFERAYEAARAAADERLEVQIALAVAGMLVDEPATREAAKTWIARARGVADRLQDPVLAALVVERDGALAFVSNDYAAATRAFRSLVDARTKLYGAADLRTALSRANLARALGKTDAAAARGELERAIADLTAARGDTHPSLAGMWNSLGGLELGLGNYKEARAAFMEARRRAVAAHSSVIQLDINLATIERRIGDLDAAKAAFARAIEALERDGRRNTKFWRVARQGLAQVAIDQDDDAAAKQILDELIALQLADKAPEPATVASLRLELAAAMSGLRDYARADAELVAARAAYVQSFGDKHVKVAYLDLRRASNALVGEDLAAAERFAAPLLARDELPADLRADAHWISANAVAKRQPARGRELATTAARLAAEDGNQKLADEIARWLADRSLQ